MATVVRPWCACGKVRLADARDVRTVESARRLHVHSADRCTVYVIQQGER